VPTPLPTWIRFPDGRLLPFESDLVSQMLFAATESVGSPNAFLARELADVVLHFLGHEDLGETAVAEQIADSAAKVLRELGQPELADRFPDCWPAPAEAKRRVLQVPFEPGEAPDVLARRCLEEYSLRAVFAPDVVSAHRDGLIRLANLDAPDRLGGVVLEPPDAGAIGSIRAARDWILDSAEGSLSDSADVGRFLQELEAAAAQAHADVWVHLHASVPASGAELAGPLFGGGSTRLTAPATESWLDAVTRCGDRMRPVWHWHGPAAEQAIFLEACRRTGGRGSVLFDRPRRPFVLSHGTNRERPAVLQEIVLDLPKLLDVPEIDGRAERLLEKLPSLSRLAISAAGQKRKYLRRHAEHLGRGFLLDRAVVRLIPRGLDAVVRRLMNVAVTETKLARAFGRRILAALADPLDAEHRRTGLNLSLAAPVEPIDITGDDARSRLSAWSEIVRGHTDGVLGFVWPAAPNDRPIELLPLLEFACEETDIVGFVWDR
jgi:hypothetical protein